MNILAILAAAALTMEYVETNYVKSDVIAFTVSGTNKTSSLMNFGITTEASFTITTNWVDDPVNSTLQLGIIYSNIIARVSYEGKTNELTMASKLVGLAGSREKPHTIFINGSPVTNLISSNIIWIDALNAN